MMYKVVVSLAKGTKAFIDVKAASNSDVYALVKVAIEAVESGNVKFLLRLMFRI
jgi:hypothetical protein